jgi:DNA-binding MarR family transcriptional regulator
MNYSDDELSRTRTNDEALVEAGMRLLPVIARALFSAISSLGNAHGLTPAQVKVLLQLGAHRQMTVGEIAAGLTCSMPAASELVDRLVDAGHLVRASDPADRRRVLIAATPEAERISAHLREMREAQVRYALDQLEPEERPTFIKSLEALVVGLTHAEGAPATDCQTARPPDVSSPSVREISPAGPNPASHDRDRQRTSDPMLANSSRGSD